LTRRREWKGWTWQEQARLLRRQADQSFLAGDLEHADWLRLEAVLLENEAWGAREDEE